MAHLFPVNALRERAGRIDTAEIQAFVAIVQRWQQDYHHGSLKRDKETSREQSYNHDFFITILGHVQRPNALPTFVPKETTSKGQLPDAVIAEFSAADPTDSISAVVELKSASVSLDRPQKREGHLSPVQQAFKYKVQFRRCPFVIVSNYYEFRLYADNMIDYEAWTLDDLCDPDSDYIKFKTWFFLLKRANFVGQPDFPTRQFLSDIREEREKIGKTFYAEYKQVRLNFLRQLWIDNPESRSNFDVAIRATQKIMDRVVFAAFAQDTGLLPDNTLARVEKMAHSGPFKQSLWMLLKQFFKAVDKGDAGLGISTGYNGGLFRDDPVLESLQIDDDRLAEVLNLSRFNFSEELTVTVLGHILEQSITDLEDIRSKVDVRLGLGPAIESQRKREGIYYTPDHVVRYMVDASLGRYLREQEESCKQKAGLFSSRRLSDETYDDREKLAYHLYQTILQQVRVLDPACGSGAFLVGALELLQAENQRVGEILGGNILSLSEFAQATLRDNLYGVDLNAEGVEITKLSLWLKTAQKDHTLSDLDQNILVGNSLVSDRDVAGAKAFEWAAAFPNVMAAGGFDVVIGNPPYVDSENMTRNDPDLRAFLASHYGVARGNWDLYVVFLGRALQLVRDHGFVSMIVPNKVLSAPYASTLRQLVSVRHRLIGITDVSHEGVFDVDVYPVIVNVAADATVQRRLVVQEGIEDRQTYAELAGDSIPDNWGLLLPSVERVAFRVPTVRLSDWFDTWSSATVSEAYELTDVLEEDAGAEVGRVINTGTIDPFVSTWGVEPMQYLKAQYRFPCVNLQKLAKHKAWYGRNKVIVAGMGTSLEAVYSVGDTYFPAKSTVVLTERPEARLPLQALAALLNSRYVSYLFEQENKQNAMAGGYMTITKDRVGLLEIPLGASEEADELCRLSLELASGLRDVQHQTKVFASAVSAITGVPSWPRRLAAWWRLDFAGFRSALKPGRLPASASLELAHLFDAALAKIVPLVRKIDAHRAELEAVVLRLYGLTEFPSPR